MKPILLLAPARSGAAATERWLVEFRREMLADDAEADAEDYSAVIVVNDGGARAVQRLRAACELRNRHGGLRIGVLWYLDEAGRARPAAIEPRLQFELREDGVQIEYQAF
jgi:hypothetical protein